MTSNLALLFAVLAMVTIAFQVALILGAPWGHLTQGRTEKGPLPRAQRGMAAVSVVVLIVMSAAILSAEGRWPGWPLWTGWLTVGLSGVTMLLNFISPSIDEKRIWGPVSALMFFSALGVMVL
jgi:hypothetical protein